jgi:hypothetical protein
VVPAAVYSLTDWPKEDNIARRLFTDKLQSDFVTRIDEPFSSYNPFTPLVSSSTLIMYPDFFNRSFGTIANPLREIKSIYTDSQNTGAIDCCGVFRDGFRKAPTARIIPAWVEGPGTANDPLKRAESPIYQGNNQSVIGLSALESIMPIHPARWAGLG